MTVQENKNQVALTILTQLGGSRRLKIMIGVKQILLDGNRLIVRWPNRDSKIGNCVEISLNGLDLYDVHFSYIRGMKKTMREGFENVYAESLIELFENHTGWSLRL